MRFLEGCTEVLPGLERGRVADVIAEKAALNLT